MGKRKSAGDEDVGAGEGTGVAKDAPPPESAAEKRGPAPQRRKEAAAFEAPTAEELSRLQQTQQLYQSNLMKMELDELLGEVRVPLDAHEKKGRQLEGCLRALKGVLDAMPEAKARARPGDVLLGGAPFHGKKAVEMACGPPERVDLVGSYLVRTVCRASRNVDVAVVIPRGALHEKDHVNYRYFDKRAMYLAYVRDCLAGTPYANVRVARFRGEPLRPVLEVRAPAESDADEDKKQHDQKRRRKAEKKKNKKSREAGAVPRGWVVRVHAVLPDDLIPARKLAPLRNSVRSVQRDGVPLATPHYNQLVLEDMRMTAHLRQLHALLADSPSLADGVILLKVWARQRECDRAPSSFGGFLLSAVVLYLASARRVTSHMSCYQVFRAALSFLATHDLSRSPVRLPAAAGDDAATAAERWEADFCRTFDVVLLDGSGLLNLAAGVTRDSYQSLRDDAARSLECLDEEPEGAFRAVFMRPVPWHTRYDAFVVADASLFAETRAARLAVERGVPATTEPPSARGVAPLPAGFGASAAAPLPPGENQGAAFVPPHPTRPAAAITARHAGSLLRRALTDRVTAASVVDSALTATGAAAAPQSPPPPLVVGLRLSPEHARRDVDMGPDAEKRAEAAEFRALWGERSELRRFRDGRISEAVVWELPAHRLASVVPEIARHILRRHLAVEDGEWRYVGAQLDAVLRLNPRLAPAEEDGAGADPMATVPRLRAAFKRLGGLLRSLAEVPLSIMQVQASHAAFRDAAAFPPRPAGLAGLGAAGGATYVEAVPVVVQFEGSTAWPDDPAAVARIKAAFYLRIAAALKAPSRAVPAVVGYEWLDVLVGGFAFRVRIFHEREVQLRKANARQRAVNAAALRARERALAAGGAGMVPTFDVTKVPPPQPDAFDVELVQRPAHSGTVRGVALRFPAFGDAARLAKRWVAAHMFACHVPDEAVELVVARAFLRPGAVRAPASGMAGFYRFLGTLASHAWRDEPLVVDVLGDMDAGELDAVRRQFREARAAKRGAWMYVATRQDPGSRLWTRERPTLPVLERMVTYARSSFALLDALLRGSGNGAGGDDAARWLTLFKTPLEQFDLFVVLRDDAVPNREEALVAPRDEAAAAAVRARVAARADAGGDSGGGGAGGKRSDLELARHSQVMVGFNPAALLLRDLRHRFHRFATFHADPMGGALVAVSIKREFLEPRRFTVSASSFSRPAGGMVSLNLDEVVADIRRLGRGAVAAVYTSYDEYASACL